MAQDNPQVQIVKEIPSHLFTRRRPPFLSHTRSRLLALLFFEEGLKSLFGLLCPVEATAGFLRTPREIIIAEIGPLLFQNAFGRDFPALIVSAKIVEVTLLATAKISIAMGAGILSDHFSFNMDQIPAKDTIHNSSSSSLKGLGYHGNSFISRFP